MGRAITLTLAEAGCNVLVHYGRSEGPAQETRREAEQRGVRAVIHSADLSQAAEAPGVVEAASHAFGNVDILVNSAAVFLEGGLDETSVENWDTQFAVNARAPFLLSQAFSRQVPGDGAGNIVNIIDARIFRPGSDHFAYRLTKSVLADMTRNLAHELAPRVRVNALALGAILPPPGKDKAYLDELARTRVPLRRAGSAELVAQNVLHLLNQEFITGTILSLDGGEFL